MDVTDFNGLAIAEITPAEVRGRPWLRSAEHIDVVRLPEPPAEMWPVLAASGFIRKPVWVTWIAELGADEDDFLSRLDADARSDIRRARHRAERSLEVVVHDPLDEGVVDAFLALYRQQIEEMEYGVLIACQQRDRLLDGAEKYFAVMAYENGEPVGGCIALECPGEDAVRLRFSAVTDRWRRNSLARALYVTVMGTARDRGYRWITLGDDPNLYGHLTKTGLFAFKAKMGFRCIPSQDFHHAAAGDAADLVLDLDHLCDPCLILGYEADRGADRQLRAHLITDEPANLSRYDAPFLAGVSSHAAGGEG